MSPELQNSLRERITARVGFEEIEAELIAAGYSQEAAATTYREAVQSGSEVKGVDLSSGTTLFKAGYAIAKQRLDVLLLLGLSSATLNIIALQTEDVEALPLIALLAGVGVVAFVVYVLGILATYFIITTSGTAHVSISDGFKWAVQNIFTLFWISILSFFIIIAGLTLFIIPGIILAVLIYFSHFAFIHDEKRGMQALLRSRAVVLGRKAPVFKRLLVIFLYSFLLSLVISLPIGIIELLEIDSISIIAVFEILTQIITALLTIITIAAANQLYLELAQGRPVAEPDKGVVLKYRILSIFGPVTLIGMLLLFVLGSLAFWGASMLPVTSESSSNEVRTQVVFTEPIAELYFEEQGTYAGVCDRLVPAVAASDSIECFSTESEWALSAETNDEYWCTDTTGYGKAIPSPLNGRTSCLNLPTSGGDIEVMNVPEVETASGTLETGEILPMM